MTTPFVDKDYMWKTQNTASLNNLIINNIIFAYINISELAGLIGHLLYLLSK